MTKTLQHLLTAVLVSAAFSLTAPAYAKHHEGTKTTHVSKGHKGKISGVEMKERRITAQLNRNQLSGNL